MSMYDTPEEAFGELARRIRLLKKAGTAFQGMIVKTGVFQLVDMRVRAFSDQHKAHNPYADLIDLFETEKGVHVGVPQAQEDVALVAELGNTKQRQDPLWRPATRRAQKQADRLARALLEAIAERVEAGEDIDAVLVREVSPKVSLGSRSMPQVREILSAWVKTEEQEL
ncbi:hypothetical protein LCGC14_0583760 [marine sediment metagenome]|uniref:Uncharacterized protein n=1 Tax=marine sediment metagenome TaxID=412755 RepID=A0A0F9RFL2_9ZZZZ